jgi:branched-chain amino acid transport system substrate-binding protein
MSIYRLSALATLVLIIVASVAWAQPVRIGVIVSLSGTASDFGKAQQAAVTTLPAELATTGVHGQVVDLSIIDDRSLPDLALARVRELVEEEVHAVICCSTAAASRLVAPYLHQQGVLMLSPSSLPGSFSNNHEKPFWTFSLRADEATIMASITAHLANSGGRSVGLMTLDNSYGTKVHSALLDGLATAQLDLAGEARYRPDATVLTPEALWVASKEPDAVVVWGLAPDVTLAVSGLRQRGYEGPVYLPSELVLGAGSGTAHLGELRSPVTPMMVVDSLGETHPSYLEATALANAMKTRYGRIRVPSEGASTYDAVKLLVKGIEQVMLIGISPLELGQFRQALRDSVIGLQPTAGASGLLDLTEQSVNATLPAGLAVAARAGGRLYYLP